MEGPQLLILQACNGTDGDQSGFVLDAEIARRTGLSLSDVRDHLETLERGDLISLVRLENPDGLKAHLEAKGRIELSKIRPFQAQSGSGRSGSPSIKVVPKGLRSFDEHDADFFLYLLPGPRRTNGLPDSIHFWKTRIEEMDPDKTFRVGYIFGPSGCGKSSLVKAGLLPRLSKPIIVHLHRGDGRGDGSPTAQRIAEAQPRPVRQPRSP